MVGTNLWDHLHRLVQVVDDLYARVAITFVFCIVTFLLSVAALIVAIWK